MQLVRTILCIIQIIIYYIPRLRWLIYDNVMIHIVIALQSHVAAAVRLTFPPSIRIRTPPVLNNIHINTPYFSTTSGTPCSSTSLYARFPDTLSSILRAQYFSPVLDRTVFHSQKLKHIGTYTLCGYENLRGFILFSCSWIRVLQRNKYA